MDFEFKPSIKKGNHRNAYLREDAQIINPRVVPIRKKKSLDVEIEVFLNKDDKVRVATKALDILQEEAMDRALDHMINRLEEKKKLGQEITEKDLVEEVKTQEQTNPLIPIAIRKGWFYIEGHLPVRKLYLE